MTIIAALVAPNGVWLAADSQSSDGGERVLGIAKLIRRRTAPPGDAVIATAGRRALSQLVQYDLALPTRPPTRTDEALDEWAYRIAVALGELAVDAKPPVLDADGAVDGHGLLAFAGRLWILGEVTASRVTTGYQAIGSGDAYAIGAFEALAALGVLMDDPERSVRLACAAAIAWDVNCGGPVSVELV